MQNKESVRIIALQSNEITRFRMNSIMTFIDRAPMLNLWLVTMTNCEKNEVNEEINNILYSDTGNYFFKIGATIR